MNSVFVLFSADCNLNYSSYSMEAVCTSKEKAIELITPILKRESKASYREKGYNRAGTMFMNLLSNLETLNQTQTLATNYVIKEQRLNALNCL